MMHMNERHMRAKHHLRMVLQLMDGKEPEKEDEEPKKHHSHMGEKENGSHYRKPRNNPFAIANAAKKKRGMSKQKTEDMTMALKKKGYDNY